MGKNTINTLTCKHGVYHGKMHHVEECCNVVCQTFNLESSHINAHLSIKKEANASVKLDRETYDNGDEKMTNEPTKEEIKEAIEDYDIIENHAVGARQDVYKFARHFYHEGRKSYEVEIEETAKELAAQWQEMAKQNGWHTPEFVVKQIAKIADLEEKLKLRNSSIKCSEEQVNALNTACNQKDKQIADLEEKLKASYYSQRMERLKEALLENQVSLKRISELEKQLAEAKSAVGMKSSTTVGKDHLQNGANPPDALAKSAKPAERLCDEC